MWDLGGSGSGSASPHILTSKPFSLQENLLPVLPHPKASLSKVPKSELGHSDQPKEK